MKSITLTIIAALLCVAHPALGAVEHDMADKFTHPAEFRDLAVTGTLDASKGTLIVPDGTEFTQGFPVDGSVTAAKLHADLSAALPRVADLASTANGKGASTIGIEDAGTLYTATHVEGALAEVRTVANAAAPSADLASTDNGKGASLIGVEDAGENYGGATNVEAVLLALHNRIAALENA